MIKIFSWAAVIFWMAIIFYLSHEPASSSDELSIGISDVMVTIVEKVVPGTEVNMDEFHHIVRKCAHFLAYLILGLLLTHTLRRSGAGRWTIGIALIICVLYASSDELHQLFVPGRSAEVRDVLIDSVGACVGIILDLLIWKGKQRYKS
ncbi:VanZ family protein [Lentibacillus sp. L22]|uniref:VanZ family protein n=1 Tax=Lentibacillus sp. L22 TaxID=3163028 RepID=UPI0034663C14